MTFDVHVWDRRQQILQEAYVHSLAKKLFKQKGYLENLKGIFIHVPKTGGNTIHGLWEKGTILCLGHVPWFVVKENMYAAPGGAAAWERCFKFTMFRNPWDRMISWFYAHAIMNETGMKQLVRDTAPKLDLASPEAHRIMFQHWLPVRGRELTTSSTFRPEGLVDRIGDGPQVDYIGCIEDFAEAADTLKEHFGPVCNPQREIRNGYRQNTSKGRPRDKPYSYYYGADEYLIGLVAGLGWYEIKHCGYHFEYGVKPV
jgi:hypothetical protein